MKNMAAPLVGLGIIPTTRGPLDALTIARAPKDQRVNVLKQVGLNPETAWDRSMLGEMYGSRTPGMIN